MHLARYRPIVEQTQTQDNFSIWYTVDKVVPFYISAEANDPLSFSPLKG